MDDTDGDENSSTNLELTTISRYVFVATVYAGKSVGEITDELDSPDRPRTFSRSRHVRDMSDFGSDFAPPLRPLSTRELVAGSRRQLERRGFLKEDDDGNYQPTEDVPVAPEAGDKPSIDVDDVLTDPGPSARIVATLLNHAGALTGAELERLSLGEHAIGTLDIGRRSLVRNDAIEVTPVTNSDGHEMRGYQLRSEQKDKHSKQSNHREGPER